MSEHCILIIEDQEDLSDLYVHTLKSAGYRARPTFTGEEGIAEFKANGADLILLDITLPEMSGAEALREIRLLDANVPVIIVTGETGQLRRSECERLGVQGYLSKPPNLEALLAIIERSLAEPSEEAEVITLRLTTSTLQRLEAIDENLERAITKLLEERGGGEDKARVATADE